MMKNMGYGGKMKEKNETRMNSLKAMERMNSLKAMERMESAVAMKPSTAKPMKPSAAKPSKAIMRVGTKKTVTKLPGKPNTKMTKTKIKMF